MIIGHLPAGYILTKKLQTRYGSYKYTWVGLLASILPDVDVINFYLDKYEIHHHDYWPHLPFYWFVTGLLVFGVTYMLKKDRYTIMSVLFFSNIFLHLLIDTVTGEVKWLYPFSDKYISFFDWETLYSFWGTILIKWSFAMEILVCIWALLIFFRARGKAKFYEA